MRRTPNLRPAILIAALIAPPAWAATACDLLDAKDIAALGIRAEAAPTANQVALNAEQSGAPAAVEADLCFHYHGPRGSDRALNVTIERYASAEGLAAWLAKQNTADGSVKRSRHGRIDCERGQYDANLGVRPASADKIQRILHFASCDVLEGKLRLAVSVEAPDAQMLPGDAAIAAVIERAQPRLR